MSKLMDARIGMRLPAMIIALMLGLSIVLSAFAIQRLATVLEAQTREQTSVLLEEYSNSIERWIDGLSRDLVGAASSPSTVEALNALASSRKMIGENPNAELRRLYIDENPHEPDERHLLASADGDGFYHSVHARNHDQFLSMHEVMGYYDIYLIDADGNVIYSVFKQDDFGTSLAEGAYSQTALADAFREAVSSPKGYVAQTDFAQYAPNGGSAAGFLATPVYRSGDNLIGVLAVQVPRSRLSSYVRVADYLREHGDVYVVGSDGYSRTASLRAESFGVLEPVSSLSGDGTVGARVDQTAVILTQDVSLGIPGWTLVAELDQSYFQDQLWRFGLGFLILASASILLSSFAGVAIARSVTRPLARFATAMTHVSQSEFDKEIPGRERSDELGELSRTLEAFRDQLLENATAEAGREASREEQIRVVSTLAEHLRRLADGDLDAEITERFADDYEALRCDFNSTLMTLDELIRSVVENAEEIKARAEEISDSSSDLSRRTENQAATLEETAAAMDQLTSSVQSAADGVVEVETVVASARRDAEDSGAIVRDAVSAMSEIKKSSDEISQIIGVIDDIAFQTNLLALNAGVEAARAGEAVNQTGFIGEV